MKRKITVVTLCSGYDSQMLACRRLEKEDPDIEFDLLAWAEIDKYAIKAHNALFPEYADRNMGDITKADWSQLIENQCVPGGGIDLMFYSTPCFKAGTLVFTDKGHKPIEEIQVGDMVLTHTNTFKRVLKVGVKPTTERKLSINPMCADHIHCTENHPFYVRERYRVWNNPRRSYDRLFHEPTWIQAKDLNKNHYVGVAIPTEEKLPSWEGVEMYKYHPLKNNLSQKFTNKAFWYIMGRYLGDGWTRYDDIHKAVIICCGGRNRQQLVDAIEAAGFHACITKERTVEKFTINSKELVHFVLRYGKYAHGKHIDNETINLPNDLLQSFIDGLIDSDGNYLKKERVYQLGSVSKELIYGLGLCVAKVYKTPFQIYRFARPKTCVIEGRTVNQRDTYTIRFKTDKRKQDNAFYEDGYVWCPINWIKEDTEEYNVYNLEVEEDNSYTANGVIVHNCQSVSNAGKGLGAVKGSGTASSLLWETERAIKDLQPKILIGENVKGLISKKHFPVYQEWLNLLKSYGYTNYYQILNAKDFGVPQNRERVFTVSIKEPGEPFIFPEPFPLENRLKDILTPPSKVPEKFFLADDKVQDIVSKIDQNKLDLCNTGLEEIVKDEEEI